MKVMIDKTTVEKCEVDVEFPIYREHCFDHSTSYMKVMEGEAGNLVEQTIDIKSDGVEIEIDSDYKFDRSSVDYLLGQGLHQSSEDEFNRAILHAKALIDGIFSTMKE